MPIIFQDTFVETSDTALTSHVPDIGTSWVQVLLTGTFVLQVIAATDDLSTSGSGGSNGQLCKINPAPSVAEYDIEYVLNTVDAGAAGRSWGAVAKISDGSATDYYRTKHLPTGHASPDCELMEMAGGTKTSLGTVDTGLTVGDVFVLEIRNNSQRLLKNGTPILTASDTTLSAAGDIGFAAGQIKTGDTGNINTVWRWDNFTVTEVDAGGPVPGPTIHHALFRN